MILLCSQHCLNVILGVTEDDPVSVLAACLGSNGFDLDTLHDWMLYPIRTVFKDVGEGACIDASERRGHRGGHGDDGFLQYGGVLDVDLNTRGGREG